MSLNSRLALPPFPLSRDAPYLRTADDEEDAMPAFCRPLSAARFLPPAFCRPLSAARFLPPLT
jgi:hypothetical protein